MSDTEFKVGDKVVRTAPSQWLSVGNIYEVTGANDCEIKIKGSWYLNYNFELVSSNSERSELEKAIEVFEKHDIRKTVHISKSTYFVGAGFDGLTKEQLLDRLCPNETPQQKEIEGIEADMRKLADRLEELKEAL